MITSGLRPRNTGRVVVTRDFLATFGRLFDRVPVRILTLDFHHQTLQKKKPARSEIMILECSFAAAFELVRLRRNPLG